MTDVQSKHVQKYQKVVYIVFKKYLQGLRSCEVHAKDVSSISEVGY